MVTATAKPPMADSRMVPFTERLMTPARSANVSPMEATTMGRGGREDAGRVPREEGRARPCQLPPHAGRRDRPQVALARPLDQDDQEDERALKDAR